MRIISGLAKLLVATVMAGILVAGLLLPYTVGLGLTANKVTEAIKTADTSSIDMSKVPLRSTITDADGNVIAYVYDQNRTYVPLSQISKSLQWAVMSIEDRRFKIHGAVDWQGTMRALLQNMSGKPIQGGSTITQQLMKNYLYLVAAKTPAEKAAAIATTPIRKLREAKMAMMYENSGHTKDQILEQYLNLVAFGPSTYGAEAAAEHFFGVHADRLTLTQAALLAAMINNPNKFNPLVGSQADVTLHRRNQVLEDMARDGYITEKAKKTAEKVSIAQDLNASSTPNGCINAPHAETNGYFCRYVLDYLIDAGMSYDEISRGGYTITATMDPDVMKASVDAVNKYTPSDDKQMTRIANVIAVVEPGAGTRKVLSLAANRPYGLDVDKGQTVQRLTTTFAPLGAGSIFKIFTVAAAMKAGLGVNAKVDVPKKYTSPLVPSHPFGNAGSFAKSMPITQALAESPNTPFVALEDQVGLKNVATMAVALGLRGYTLDAGDVDRAFSGTGSTYQQEITAQKMASFTLGVSPVSPLELSNVGATLDSDGTWCPPTPVAAITDRNGAQVSWKQQPCDQAVPPDLAHTLTNALYGDMHDKDGTAYQAAQKAGWTRVSASKTGTTQEYKSSAFLGYTPYYSAAVVTWDYLNHPTSMCVDPVRSCSQKQAESGDGMSGGTVPAQTWLEAMTPLHQGEPDTPFPVSTARYLAGEPKSHVPSVVGLTLADAKAKLSALGFKVPESNISYSNKTAAAVNVVVEQNPTSTALPGSAISLVVSTGPKDSGG